MMSKSSDYRHNYKAMKFTLRKIRKYIDSQRKPYLANNLIPIAEALVHNDMHVKQII